MLTVAAEKSLRRIPVHIFRKFEFWVKQVTIEGIASVRKIPGFHDEPLKGELAGLRSIRLSRSYRAIYQVLGGGTVLVEEINKHEY